MAVATESYYQTSPETELLHNETYRTRDWNENVLHIYPRTFNEERPEDTDHRGVGSILGITKKLDWIADTGMTAIWLGPIYESPGLDGNYDVSDYYAVDRGLGTIEDVKDLIDEAHKRDIRVIFDLVPNHTSDQAEWFKISSNPNDPKYEAYKDFYIWHDPIEGQLPRNIVGSDRLEGLPKGLSVPNNWSSVFSLTQIDKVRGQHDGEIPEGTDVPAVTAWVWNEARQQFYLAEFMKEQPSLNWAVPIVREEIKKVVRFWLDLGIDGFRVDSVNNIGKDSDFVDEEVAPAGAAIGEYKIGTTNPHDQWKQERLVSHWPELGNYANDLVSVLDEQKYKDRNIRFILEDWISAMASDSRLDNLRPDRANVFNFETLLNTDRTHWTAENIGRIIQGYYSQLQSMNGAIPNQVTGNHDTDTLRTRLGSVQTARAAYLMLAALPGAFYTWQGDLLGRPNMIVPEELQKDGKTGKRDGERVPMQWDSSKNGGFSKAEPGNLWLPSVNPSVYIADNIELQERDPHSPYRFIKDILQKRKTDPALHEGLLLMLHTDHDSVLAFARRDPIDSRRQVISITNFSQDSLSVSLLGAQQACGRIALSSIFGLGDADEAVDLDKPIKLGPDESYLIDAIT